MGYRFSAPVNPFDQFFCSPCLAAEEIVSVRSGQILFFFSQTRSGGWMDQISAVQFGGSWRGRWPPFREAAGVRDHAGSG